MAFLQANPGATVTVRGHTDTGLTAEERAALSQGRADAIVDRLVALGVDPARLTAAALSDSDPIATNDTPEGRALNRRVDFEITGN